MITRKAETGGFSAMMLHKSLRLSLSSFPRLTLSFTSVPSKGLIFVIAILLVSPYSLAQASSNQNETQLLQQAQQAMDKSDFGTAIKTYQQLIKLAGQSAPLFLGLGVAEYNSGDYGSAAASLKQALKLRPGFPQAEAFLGLSEAMLGHNDRGAPLLQESFDSNDKSIDPQLRHLIGVVLGKLYTSTGRLNEADAVYSSLLKDYPYDPEVLYQSFMLGWTRTRQIMRTMLARAPNSYRTHQMLAYLLAEKGNYPAAAEQLKVALKENPNAVGLHYQLGNMLLATSPDGKTAVKEYEEELSLHPFHAGSYYQLGEIAFRNHQLDRAWDFYKKALHFDPTMAGALVGLANISMSRNQTQQALGYCEQAVKEDPNNRGGHYLLARIYRTLGRTEEAQAQMDLFETLQSEANKEKQYLSIVQSGDASAIDHQ